MDIAADRGIELLQQFRAAAVLVPRQQHGGVHAEHRAGIPQRQRVLLAVVVAQNAVPAVQRALGHRFEQAEGRDHRAGGQDFDLQFAAGHVVGLLGEVERVLVEDVLRRPGALEAQAGDGLASGRSPARPSRRWPRWRWRRTSGSGGAGRRSWTYRSWREFLGQGLGWKRVLLRQNLASRLSSALSWAGTGCNPCGLGANWFSPAAWHVPSRSGRCAAAARTVKTGARGPRPASRSWRSAKSSVTSAASTVIASPAASANASSTGNRRNSATSPSWLTGVKSAGRCRSKV